MSEMRKAPGVRSMSCSRELGTMLVTAKGDKVNSRDRKSARKKIHASQNGGGQEMSWILYRKMHSDVLSSSLTLRI